MSIEDLHDLYEAGKFAEQWAFTIDNAGESLEAMRFYMETGLANCAQGIEQPLVQIHRESGEIVGSTRLHQVAGCEDSYEIGWTWIRPDHQGTKINPEAKLLLLTFAFEELGAVRVQLKTDDRNLKSQAAIRKIGAQFEGVLRLDRPTWNGHRRSTHMFSILREEWPEVRERLQKRLES